MSISIIYHLELNKTISTWLYIKRKRKKKSRYIFNFVESFAFQCFPFFFTFFSDPTCPSPQQPFSNPKQIDHRVQYPSLKSILLSYTYISGSSESNIRFKSCKFGTNQPTTVEWNGIYCILSDSVHNLEFMVMFNFMQDKFNHGQIWHCLNFIKMLL